MNGKLHVKKQSYDVGYYSPEILVKDGLEMEHSIRGNK